MRAVPTNASRRRGIGVGPACASCPTTVISYQRWPCAPVTTPIGLPAASRIGPCSICASKYAAAGRPPKTLGEIEHAGEHPRADHRRRKPGSLFIGPGSNLDRSIGLVADVV